MFEKLNIDIQDSFHHAWFHLYLLMYSGFIPGVISVMLQLTKTLWNPAALYRWIMFSTEGGIGSVDYFMFMDSTKNRCLNATQTLAAISNDSDVSGFYGPGAYLAWLITSWAAAISSIAGNKIASNNPERLELDLELLAVVSYPLIAGLDITWRLIRCKVDASLTAASTVVIASLMIVSPVTRLSIQAEGTDLMDWLNEPLKLFDNKRWLLLAIPRWLGHGICGAISGEPYASSAALITLWSLLFVTVIYSGVNSGQHWYKDKLSPLTWRPWKERVVFFCLVQLVFGIVLVTTGNRSFWPSTSASFLDLDQITAVLCALVNLLVSRRESFKALLKSLSHWIKRLWRSVKEPWRSRRVQQGVLEGESIEPQNMPLDDFVEN